MGDVRGRWPAIVDINLTQHSLELPGSTIPIGHREHTTNHAAATILMDYPTLVVATNICCNQSWLGISTAQR